ncbi:MAG: hypothetical protein ACRYGK_01010 [Janthinobacterium lividum]
MIQQCRDQCCGNGRFAEELSAAGFDLLLGNVVEVHFFAVSRDRPGHLALQFLAELFPGRMHHIRLIGRVDQYTVANDGQHMFAVEPAGIGVQEAVHRQVLGVDGLDNRVDAIVLQHITMRLQIEFVRLDGLRNPSHVIRLGQHSLANQLQDQAVQLRLHFRQQVCIAGIPALHRCPQAIGIYRTTLLVAQHMVAAMRKQGIPQLLQEQLAQLRQVGLMRRQLHLRIAFDSGFQQKRFDQTGQLDGLCMVFPGDCPLGPVGSESFQDCFLQGSGLPGECVHGNGTESRLDVFRRQDHRRRPALQRSHIGIFQRCSSLTVERCCRAGVAE